MDSLDHWVSGLVGMGKGEGGRGKGEGGRGKGEGGRGKGEGGRGKGREGKGKGEEGLSFKEYLEKGRISTKYQKQEHQTQTL